jgi:cytochrome c553
VFDYRDVDVDSAVGTGTIPVRLGRRNTIYSLIGLAAALVGVSAWLATREFVSPLMPVALARQLDLWNEPGSWSVVKKGRTFFLQSCSSCHGSDAEGGEDAPSLQKLQISGAHMALLIQSGLKDEMPSFSKKYNEQDTAAIVAYLKTLH